MVLRIRNGGKHSIHLKCTNNNQIFISSSVVSEFVNRWLRLDFEKNFQDDKKTKDFKKDYRVSENYKKTINLILKTIKKIYNNYNIFNIDDSYVEFDIFGRYKNIDIDFNDLILTFPQLRVLT